MFKSKLVRILVALAIGLTILPIRTAFAGRWGQLDDRFLAFGHLDENPLCRDGMIVTLVRYRDSDRPFTPLPQPFNFLLGSKDGSLLATATLTVTTEPRPELWADIDLADAQPPYLYYASQKVFWNRLLTPGDQVVVQSKNFAINELVEADPAAISDCYLGERNSTAAERDALASVLPTGDAKTDNRIRRVLAALDRSLAPELWQADGVRLTQHGRIVFNEFSRAVRHLTRIGHPSDAVAHAITTLPVVACGLAQTAIEDAVAAGGNAGKIARAQTAFDKGQAQLHAGDFRGAIRQFKLAWLHAQRALGQWQTEIDENVELADDPGATDE